MLTQKIKKALCLSLLVSCVVSISAEGWFDSLKKHITPAKVAGCVAASGLFYHYWVMRRKTRTITINGQQINVSALNLELSNYQDVHAEIRRGDYSTLPDNEISPLNHVAVDTNGNELFGFKPRYTLDNNYREHKIVSLRYNKKLGQRHLPCNWVCLCCSNSGADYTTTQNELARALYDSTNESETKGAYAEQLHTDYLSNRIEIDLHRRRPQTETTIRAIEAYELQNQMLLEKHTRVMDSL